MILRSAARFPIRLQIAGLLVVTQLLAHVLTVTVMNLAIPDAKPGQVEDVGRLVSPLITILRAVPPGEGAGDLFARLAESDPQFRLGSAPVATGEVDEAIATRVAELVPAVWRDRVTVRATGSLGWFWAAPSETDLIVEVALPDGQRLQFSGRPDVFLRAVPLIVLVPSVLLLALPLMLLSIWAGSALVAPITSLARGSERFAADLDAPDIAETGPEEVRSASRAFNAMRVKIRSLVTGRSRTLAAIGHDMRTPLTRLRLRLEALDLGVAAEAAEEDIQVLERMIDDALMFLRNEEQPLVRGPMDMAVLAQTIVDDFADRGHRVRYDGPLHLPLLCDHDQMRRVLENIVGNATKYADDTVVRITEEDEGGVTICVADSGPGIAPEHRDHVLEPFSRIEVVQSGGPSAGKSFGLGLAIARDIVTRHGGSLTLGENFPEGLLVTIRLPRQVEWQRPEDEKPLASPGISQTKAEGRA